MSDTRSATGPLLPTNAPLPADLDLDILFQNMVVGITGLAPTLVRPRYQVTPPNQPPNTTNWCGVGVIGQDPDAGPYFGHKDIGTGVDDNGKNLGEDHLQRHEEIVVLASFYGPNGKGYAGLLRDGLSVEMNRWPLSAVGILFQYTGTILPVNEKVAGEWNLRADMHLTFARQIDRVYNVRSLLSSQFTLIRG